MSPENSPQNLQDSRTEGYAGIGSLSVKRRRWVGVTRENDFEDGIKKLLTQLYPDTAHFIYELLQNAEDAGASEVRFNLESDHLRFEHDGSRLFSYDDVERITSIGSTVQRDDPTRIGEFGIGFKAVFGYTRQPQIESGPYHFRIVDMVVPEEVENRATASAECHQTRFLFPFDNPDKPRETACSEVENSLRELEDTTLLFLKNIRKIEYRFPDSTTGSMALHQCDDPNHVSIAVDRSDSSRSLHHFIRFERDICVIDEPGESKTCRIAVAFGMQQRSDDGGWRITAISPGRVCIYFPAIKETSNLRFHLHAPFASTVARDSVRECESNDRLRDHLAELIAESMIDVRRYGHLTVSFLELLPNCSDDISYFYRPFMTRLIETFRERELLPMKSGGHAPASGAYRADRRVLSDLIDDTDLAVLLREEDPTRPLWIAHPPQRNQRADGFLKMLGIETWGIDELIGCLSDRSDELTAWMKGKPHEWHQQLYALLDEQLPRGRFHVPQPEPSELHIILCTDGDYRTGKECYLPDSHGRSDEDFPRVDRQVYSSGKDKKQQDAARRFLEQAGVREVDDTVRVETILEKRYTQGDSSIDDDTVRQDMEAFMRLVKKDQKQADLFSDYFVFEADGGGGPAAQPLRCKPKDVFLDTPYRDTGLSACHTLPGSLHRKRRLAIHYQELGVDPDMLVDFADSTGAQCRLEAKQQEIESAHPEYDYLCSAPGNRSRYWEDTDFTIEEVKGLIRLIDIDRAKLIWRTMDNLESDYLKARLQKNRSQEAHCGSSTLVHQLRQARWVPQKSDGSVNFVRPRDASSVLLPEGFPYERGKEWIDAVQFGKAADDRSAQARRDGFDNHKEKQLMVKIAKWCRTRGVSPNEVLQRLMREAASAGPAHSAGVRDDRASGWASSNECGTAGEPQAVLLAIGEWWNRNKDERRCEYDRLVYPQDFDPARLQDEPIDRSAWLTLFALAAFNTLGRTQDAQHRMFIERGCQDGWWSEIARSTPPDNVKPWLDRLRAWSGVEQVEEYQLWRRAFVDLYTIVRWLDEYAVVMRKLPRIAAQRGGDAVSLHDVLRPGQSPLFGELGIEAAPLDRTLGIGINWMIREMLRTGTYDAGDEAVMAPYCWMPSRRVRERLLARLPFEDVSDDANSDDSRHIHGFVARHIGCDQARFDGDFDLPLQLITKKEHTEALIHCFSDGMIGQ